MLENTAFLQLVKYLLYGIVKGHSYAAKCTQTCGDASQKRKRGKNKGRVERGRFFSPKILNLWRKKQARIYSVWEIWKNLWFGVTGSTATHYMNNCMVKITHSGINLQECLNQEEFPLISVQVKKKNI